MTLGFFSRLLVLSAFIAMLASCKEEEPPPLDCTTLKLDILGVDNVSICGAEDGKIVVSASQGVEPYSYELNSIKNSTGVFEGLQAGIYAVTVTGGNNKCRKTIEVSVKNEGSNFNALAIGTGSTQCAPASNGLITITASNGVEPYTYRLITGPFQNESVIEGLGAGNYLVEAKDSEGCVVLVSIAVPGMRYETIRSLIELNCAVKNCHNGDLGAQSNYLLVENVKENSTGIRARTSNKTMPPSGNLTQEQIDLIACWVDEGANI